MGSHDPEIIKAWWEQDPIANIGIVTAVSPLSRVLIIDVDTKPGKPNGWESISDLVKEYEPLPETMSVNHPVGRDAPLLRAVRRSGSRDPSAVDRVT